MTLTTCVVSCGLFLLVCSTVTANDGPPADPTKAVAEVCRLWATGDSLVAIEFVERQGEPAAVMHIYSAACDHLYWKQKDLSATILLARAGIQFGLAEARRLPKESAAKLRGQVKALAYNLGSYTWPGWNEPGIETTGRDVHFGLDAAKLNLRLAKELDRDALPMSRAHWLVGAQWLAAGEFELAENSLQEAAAQAKQAENQGEELLSLGYVAVSRILEGSHADQGRNDLTRIQQQLRGVPDGEFFIQQLDTALKALSRDAVSRKR